MPTGYTAIIEDGDGCTPEEFVWHCARAFGALLDMRDDPLESIPRMPTLDSHYKEWVERSRARVDKYESMTLNDAQATMEAELEKRREADRSINTSRAIDVDRYKVILAWLNERPPPTADHQRLWDFMRDQIEVSCPAPARLAEEFEERQRTAGEWLAERRERARDRLCRDEKNLAEAIKRNGEACRWLTDLNKAHPSPLGLLGVKRQGEGP